MWYPPIGTVGMNLITLQFGAFFRRRINDDMAPGIDSAGHFEGCRLAMTKSPHQHFDDIIIGVVVII